MPRRQATNAIRRAVTVPAVSLGALILLTGCVGEVIGDPDVEIAQLAMTANSQGALTADDCVAGQGCTSYPNPKACDQLLVSVRGDGSAIGHCSKTKGVMHIIRGIGEGMPIACELDRARGCVRCVDLYGSLAVNHCGAGSDLPAEKSFQADTPTTESSATTTPPTAEAATCTQQAQQGFVERLNKLLEAEGVAVRWTPDLSKLKPIGGIVTEVVCTGLGLVEYDDRPNVPVPETFWPVDPFVRECDPGAMLQGHCYCTQVPLAGSLCRCGRLMGEQLLDACGDRPPECSTGDWARAIFPVFGAASLWLKALFILPTKGPGDVICEWSPLVLDLEGDGVELSPVSHGVNFDLTGDGTLRTAWVRGSDDALLALDRDGSGTIDNGAELFGEGTPLAGRKAADGFEALAALDRPEQGGNGNGLVDPGDLMFDQLVLWRDADHNGRSEAGELAPLESAGVVGLEVSGSAAETIIDPHGNNLSLRARFLRADGRSGLLVDAFFATTAP